MSCRYVAAAQPCRISTHRKFPTHTRSVIIEERLVTLAEFLVEILKYKTILSQNRN
jgi:hypothetical protein